LAENFSGLAANWALLQSERNLQTAARKQLTITKDIFGPPICDHLPVSQNQGSQANIHGKIEIVRGDDLRVAKLPQQ
jgi:hypothetical protein